MTFSQLYFRILLCCTTFTNHFFIVNQLIINPPFVHSQPTIFTACFIVDQLFYSMIHSQPSMCYSISGYCCTIFNNHFCYNMFHRQCSSTFHGEKSNAISCSSPVPNPGTSSIAHLWRRRSRLRPGSDPRNAVNVAVNHHF